MNYKNKLSKEVNTFLDKLASGKPFNKMTPQDARIAFDKLQASYDVDMSWIQFVETQIQGVKCYNVYPEADNYDPDKIIIFFHGGGQTLGSTKDHIRLIRDIVVSSGYPCISVDYSLSPEVKYPIALEECYQVAKHVCKKYKDVAIVGNSAGGNLAFNTTNRLIDNGYNVACQVLMWPVCDEPYQRSSWREFEDIPTLTAVAMRWYWDNYKTSATIYDSPVACPCLRRAYELVNLPPTLIEVAECDILRDEGEELGRIIQDAGVDCTTIRFNGATHDWGLFNALADTPQTKLLIETTSTFLRRHLN